MDDLEKLEEYIPKLKEDYQYSELAKKISMAISLGRTSVVMKFDQPLSEDARTKLKNAKVSFQDIETVGALDTSSNYKFTF